MTLAIEKLAGLVTIQDLGRAGFLSQAVPPSGAMVRALARNANASIGNDERAACVEIFGRAVFVAKRRTRIATDDGAVRALVEGERFIVAPIASQRVRYVAIEGGVLAPVVLGSRSSFLGSALRVGDVIERAEENISSTPIAPVPFDTRGPVRIIAGPDSPSLATWLASRTWRISASSDRKGTRLEGAPLARAFESSLVSSPMIVGAIQLPPSGMPIVIGPEGPTTGGYACVACIVREDLDRFHTRALGAEVGFEVHAVAH